MQYAIVDGNKVEATKSGERGKCQGCGNEVVAKCGEIKINHWAHLSSQQCDFEREPETEWHREWKSHFKNLEVRQEKDGEVCIADALNSKGVAIEFQHSPINAETIKKRERVHGKVIWVVDCRSKDVRYGKESILTDEQRKHNADIKKQMDNLLNASFHKYITDFSEGLYDGVSEYINATTSAIISRDYLKRYHKKKMGAFYMHTKTMLKIEIEDLIKGIYYNHLQKTNQQFIDLNNQKVKPQKVLTYNWVRASAVWSFIKLNLFLQVDNNTLLYVKDNLNIDKGRCTKIDKKEFLRRYAV
jgi:hypothetical protein